MVPPTGGLWSASEAAYLDAFASAGLHVRACYEPRLGEATGVRHFMSNPSQSEEAIARVAFQGLPGAIVWYLRK